LIEVAGDGGRRRKRGIWKGEAVSMVIKGLRKDDIEGGGGKNNS